MTSAVRQGGAALAHLRAATRPAHDRLEGALGLLDDRLDLDAYTRVLGRIYGFWREWEPHVAALLRDETFLDPRRRLHLLAADLAAVGCSAQAVAALPRCPPSALGDAVEAFGSLYVIEGSTLGGRVIERNVARCLGLDAGAGCSYFAGYRAETGAMWRAFLLRLDATPPDDAKRIAVGACATFERLGWWLARH